jgi:ATP-binding protein involved in chromosome partitioning
MRSGIDSRSVVIAVASGKGGVGKSTVSLNLALALAERPAEVGLLDADLYGPDIPLMVDLKRTLPRDRWMLWRSGEFGPVMLEPVERYGLKLMSLGFLIGEAQALSLPAELLRAALAQIAGGVKWGALDYLIIDLPPGTADLQQQLFSLVRVAGALVVVGPQDAAHLDGRKVIDMLRASRIEVIGGVENMAGLVCPHCGELVEVFPQVREERSIWHAGIERLVSIPLDPAVARAGDAGTPILLAQPDGIQAGAYRGLAARVVDWARARPEWSEAPGSLERPG